MTYTPRTTMPSNDDLRWRAQTAGGYNNFPNVKTTWNSVTPYSGSVLANCTGYCAGRWMELGNTNTPYGFHSNAKGWLSDAKSAGYETGSEPKLGAVIVFDGWSSNPSGHVGIVEEISEDGSYIKCSESNWTRDESRGYFEYPVIRYRSTGWKRSGSSSGSAIGFVYHPNITPPTPVETYSLTVVNGTGSVEGKNEGDVVSITATVPKGKKFNGWTLEGSGSIENKQNLTSKFTFGKGNATVTANLIDKKSSNWVVYACGPIYRRN